MAFSPDGTTLAVGRTDGTIRFWVASSFRETDLPRVLARGGDRSVLLEWSPLPHARAYRVYRALIPHNRLKLPVTLRLIRRGDAVTAAYSTDDGGRFQPAGEPIPLVRLAKTPFVGLAITSLDPTKVTEARFRNLTLRSLPAPSGRR